MQAAHTTGVAASLHFKLQNQNPQSPIKFSAATLSLISTPPIPQDYNHFHLFLRHPHASVVMSLAIVQNELTPFLDDVVAHFASMDVAVKDAYV
jgi:hypothetical protein